MRFRRPQAPLLQAVAAVAIALLALPLVALLTQVRWGNLADDLQTAGAADALTLSLRTTLTTVVVCAVIGTPVAWLLARSHGRWISFVRALITVPLVLPPVVGGVALLMAWGRNGLIGGPLYDWFGISLPYNWIRVVIAESFVALPFYVLAVEGSLRTIDSSFDELASTLGASPTRRFFTLSLPMALPGIISGATLAWARALGEFGATITFAGSFPGVTQTAPLAVYQSLDISQDAATAVSALMLITCVIVLATLRGRWLR